MLPGIICVGGMTVLLLGVFRYREREINLFNTKDSRRTVSARWLQFLSGGRMLVVFLYCRRKQYRESAIASVLGLPTMTWWKWLQGVVAASCWEALFLKLPLVDSWLVILVEQMVVGAALVMTKETDARLVLLSMAVRFVVTANASLAVRMLWDVYCNRLVKNCKGAEVVDKCQSGCASSAGKSLTSPCQELPRTKSPDCLPAVPLDQAMSSRPQEDRPLDQTRSASAKGVTNSEGEAVHNATLPLLDDPAQDHHEVSYRESSSTSAPGVLTLGDSQELTGIPPHLLDLLLHLNSSVAASPPKPRPRYYQNPRCRLSYMSIKVDHEPEDFQGFAEALQAVVCPVVGRHPVMAVQTAAIRGCVHLFGLMYQYDAEVAYQQQPSELEGHLGLAVRSLRGVEDASTMVSIRDTGTHENAFSLCGRVSQVYPPCLTVGQGNTLLFVVDQPHCIFTYKLVVFTQRGVHVEVKGVHQTGEDSIRLEIPPVTSMGVVNVALVLADCWIASLVPLLVLPQSAGEELAGWWEGVLAGARNEIPKGEGSTQVLFQKAAEVAMPLITDMAFVMSMGWGTAAWTESAGGQGGLARSEVVTDLLVFLKENLPFCHDTLQRWVNESLQVDNPPQGSCPTLLPGGRTADEVLDTCRSDDTACTSTFIPPTQAVPQCLPVRPGRAIIDSWRNLGSQLQLSILGFTDVTLEACYQQYLCKKWGKRDVEVLMYCLGFLLLASGAWPLSGPGRALHQTPLLLALMTLGMYVSLMAQGKRSSPWAQVMVYLPTCIYQVLQMAGALHRLQAHLVLCCTITFIGFLASVVAVACLQPCMMQVNVTQLLVHMLLGHLTQSSSPEVSQPELPRGLLITWVLVYAVVGAGCAFAMEVWQRQCFLDILAKRKGDKSM